MKKTILLLALMVIGFSVFSQKDSSKQFMLVVRYNPKMKAPSEDAIESNLKHWNEFMGGLGQNGQIVSAYRPSIEGKVITNKQTMNKAYNANNESISSVIIIRATNIEAAQSIAQKCPILEFNGTIEVRSL